MRKQTISALLTALMICLTIAIVVLIIRIQMRTPITEEPVNTNNYIEQGDTESQNAAITDSDAETAESVETVLIAVTNAASSVNVRSGPGTDYERVGSAYPNNEYEVLEILSSGWSKILYSGQEAYISNDYIDYQMRRTDGNGNIFYDAVTEEILSEYMMLDSPAGSEDEPDNPEDTNQE